MTVRPIDMQVMLPKVQEVSRTQQIQNQQEQNLAQQFSAELQKKTKQADSQVQTTKESAGNRVKKDKRKSEDQDSSDSKRRSSAEEDQEDPNSEPKDPNLGTHVDIKV